MVFGRRWRFLTTAEYRPPCTIDGISGADNIAELWRQHYSTLFNCVESDIYVPDAECVDSKVILSHEASHTINKLTDNRASGLDHNTSENMPAGG